MNGFIANGGHHKEHMKFSPIGKFNYFHDHLKMPANTPTNKRHKTALDIVHELGSESNAHGLAKIAMSTKTKRKVLWSLLVIIGFTAATLQLSLLVKKYLQFQVVEVSEMREGMPVEFPSVTICNNHAMSLTKLKERMDFVKDYEDWIFFTTAASFGENLKSRVVSTQGFYENMPSEAHIIGHDINETLLHCRFNQMPCNASQFSKYFDGKNYFNCYTFNSLNKDSKKYMHATGPQNGLSIVMALDNDDPPLGAYGVYNINDNIAHSAGLRVQVHAPNTMPSPVDHGFDIPPGYSSSVGLKAVMNSRLPSPYGNCTDEKLKGKTSYRNTIFSCLQLCKQKEVIKECKCRSSGLPNPTDSNLTYCGTFENWRRDLPAVKKRFDNGNGNQTYLFNENLDCEERVLHRLSNDRSYEVGCKCFQPCKETTFQKSISLSYWPLEFYQYNALQQFYPNKEYEKSFMAEAYNKLKNHIKKYEPLFYNLTEENQQTLLKNNISFLDRQKLMRAGNLIHQNLLRLNVYLEDLSVIEFKQIPDYDLADLFADIGGTLGLWMGISVLTIMELVELVILLVVLLFKSENKYPDPEDHGSSNGILDHHSEPYPHDSFDPYRKPEFQTFEKNDYGRTAVSEPPDSPV